MTGSVWRPAARRWGPSSLGGRLLISAAFLVISALLLTGLALDVTLERFIRGQVDVRLDGQLATVEDALYLRADGSLGLERFLDGPPFDRSASGWYWQVRAPDPVLQSRSLGDGVIAIGQAEPPGPRGGSLTADGRGPPDEPLRTRLRRILVGGRAVTVVATAPLAALRGPLREVMTPVLSILALLGAALLGGVVVQVRLGLRPLDALRSDLARVRAGRAARIAKAQPREVRPLVDELNLLLDENAANLERARRNVANLAHGLKTPLATLSLAVDAIGGDLRGAMRPLVDRMDRLIRHHLARARAAALGGASRDRNDLAEAVADHVAILAKLQADKQLAFAVAVGRGIAVAVESQDLDEVLGNLLDNAGRWARGQVAVTGESLGQRIGVSVEDDGPGMPDDLASEMLLPGRRIDEGAPGHGFGLPITRELVELYGGSLALSRSALGGLKVTIDLPSAS